MKKKALVLSGGGALGAYEVGAIKALREKGRSWDTISGVSVGSINGASIALMSGTIRERTEKLESLWREIDNGTVYKKHAPWFLNYIWSFWKKSIYSMKPLEEYVKKQLDGGFFAGGGIPFHVGVVNIQNGRYYSVDVSKLSLDEAVRVIHASCVFPGLFEPVELSGIPGLPHGEYVDGGIRDTIPLRSVLTAHPEIEEVDVVITSPRNGHVKYQHKFKSAIDVGLRAAFIMSDEVMLTDRIQGICRHHEVKLNLYAPLAPLRFDGFEFSQDAIGEMIIQGYDETMGVFSS